MLATMNTVSGRRHDGAGMELKQEGRR